MTVIQYKPIGIIHSPFVKPEGMPIQPAGAEGIEGTVEVFEEFQPGLKDIDGFSHIILLYHFHHSKTYELHVIPFMDSCYRGVFATRAPKRPNPIGLSIVRLNKVEDGILHIENVDIIDGTPVLDIKPYVPQFDYQTDVKAGWIEKSKEVVADKISDSRFA